MNVSVNWLKEYVDFDHSPEDLADRLMMLGIEVESIKRLGEGLDRVAVGRINAVREHARANNLVLCDVDVGSDADLQIVCGAPNARVGLLAPVALVGAELPSGVTVGAANIRGERSHGMLCSESELNISDEASGLMELPDNLKAGTPLVEALGLDDVMMELEITPNRPDCLSMIGVAREISVITGNSLKIPQSDVRESAEDIRDFASVTIDAADLCPRYAARLIRGVKVAPSPIWLQRRLETVGMGSINNVVDITNFALMEFGQPLHAFDFHRLGENRIVVRRVKAGEMLKTLDEEERNLTSDMLVIADAEKPVALAGVMGGFESEITEQTVDVLLESAYFHPSSIRKTSKTLGMHTEASHRFERGVDPEGVIPAINRAAQLIAEIAGGEVSAGIIDVYPRVRNPDQIKLRPERVNFVLGTDITPRQIRDILTRLGFTVTDDFDVSVPTFRPDVIREIDLIEEIARVYGYDNIPIALPQGNLPTSSVDPKSMLRQRVKTYLLDCGMMEAINYSFYHPNVFDRIRLNVDDPLRRALPIRNPLVEDFSTMRTTLIPSLLENAKRNANHQVADVQLFEIAKVFIPSVPAESVETNGEFPNELERVAGIVAGSVGTGVFGDPQRPADFFDIKGIVEGVLDVCGIAGETIAQTEHPTFHPGRSAEILVGGKKTCVLGEIHPEVIERYDLPNKAYLFELDFEALVEASKLNNEFEPISIYPSVNRDLAIVLDAEIPSSRPTNVIKSVAGKYVNSVRLFDLYTGEQVPDGKKSLAYAIEYHSNTQTLTDEIVDQVHDKIVRTLENELGAELRR